MPPKFSGLTNLVLGENFEPICRVDRQPCEILAFIFEDIPTDVSSHNSHSKLFPESLEYDDIMYIYSLLDKQLPCLMCRKAKYCYKKIRKRDFPVIMRKILLLAPDINEQPRIPLQAMGQNDLPQDKEYRPVKRLSRLGLINVSYDSVKAKCKHFQTGKYYSWSRQMRHIILTPFGSNFRFIHRVALESDKPILWENYLPLMETSLNRMYGARLYEYQTNLHKQITSLTAIQGIKRERMSTIITPIHNSVKNTNRPTIRQIDNALIYFNYMYTCVNNKHA